MILQRYVLRELVLVFLLVFLVLLSVVIIAVTLGQVHRYMEVGLGFIIYILPYFIPRVIIYTIPMAILITSIFTFGRLSGDNEILMFDRSWPPVLLI